MNIGYFIASTEEAETCLAARLFGNARIFCAAPDFDSFHDLRMGGRTTSFPVDGMSDCQLMNLAMQEMRSCEPGSQFLVMVHPWVSEILRLGQVMDTGQIHRIVLRVAELMDSLGAELGGFSFAPEWKDGRHELAPFSTVRPVCPGFFQILPMLRCSVRKSDGVRMRNPSIERPIQTPKSS